MPQKILDAPELHLGLELYWTAYEDLSSCRPSGFGTVLPISTTTALDYAGAMGLDGEQTEALVYLVRRMDEAFRKWVTERHGDQPKLPGAGGTAARPRG